MDKKMLHLILLLTIFAIVSSYKDSDYIRSPLIFPHRKNFVLFAISEDCTLDAFKNLLKVWTSTDGLIAKPYDLWTTNIYFSNQFTMTYSNSTYNSDIDEEQLYVFSKTTDLDQVTTNFMQGTIQPCSYSGTTVLIFIFSDQCFLKTLYSIDPHYSAECPIEYRTSVMVVPDSATSSACRNAQSDSSHIRLWLYDAATILASNMADWSSTFFNQWVNYYGKLHTSRLNVFAVISNLNYDKKRIIYDYIYDKIAATGDCHDGDFIGFFQVDDVTGDSVNIRVIPINLGGNIDYFVYNIESAWNTDAVVTNDKTTCPQIYDAINTMMQNPLTTKQYNVLFLDISYYPHCVNFAWNMINRHLEIYVFDGKASASTFLTLVQPNVNLSNHIYFPSKNATEIAVVDTVCKSRTLQARLVDTFGLETTPTSTTQKTSTSKIPPSLPTIASTSSSSATSSSSLPTSVTSLPSMPTITTTTGLLTSTITSSTSNGSYMTKWYIILGAGIILILLVIVILFYYIPKRRIATHNRTIKKRINEKLEMSPLEKHLSSKERFTLFINADLVVIDFNSILKRGAYTTIFKANIKDKKNPTPAAIKLPITFTDDDIEKFVRELDALIIVGSHSNIIGLLGWTTHADAPGLLTELAEQSLFDYVVSLKLQERPFRPMLSILCQIAKALEYIAKFSLVHRDVACRSIQLAKNRVPKLADFGLCCRCDTSTHLYRANSSQQRVPLRWLSLEAMTEYIFSEKSDVWAFGVLCYEAYTFGTLPYSSLSNAEIQNFLKAGNRLEKPIPAPDVLYQLMQACWKEHPLERPSFHKIVLLLEEMIENRASEYDYIELVKHTTVAEDVFAEDVLYV